MANMLTHLARGDTALSITMTAISQPRRGDHGAAVPRARDAPLRRHRARRERRHARGRGPRAADHGRPAGARDVPALAPPQRIAAIEPRAKRSRSVVFVGVVVGAIVAENERVLDNLDDVAAARRSRSTSRRWRSPSRSRGSPGSTTASRPRSRSSSAIHNATLAIAIGATIATVLTIPAAVYSAFMFVTAGLFARLMHRRNIAT